MKRLLKAAIIGGGTIAPFGAEAHPHVFVDASVQFLLDDVARLTAVRITHLYDPLVSLFVLQDLGFDPFAPLTDAEAARLTEEQRILLEGSQNFAELTLGTAVVATEMVHGLVASVEDGRMRVDFTLPLAEPAMLSGTKARLAIYDPVYFIAFNMTDRVTASGSAVCSARPTNRALSAGLLALQAQLAEIPPDETPEDPTVGRLFAAEAQLSCL